jgi:hypothetical protein
MSGPVTPFVDYSQNTASDDGENNLASVLPPQNGEALNQTVLGRSIECLRQRFEVLRSVENDSLYLRDSQQRMLLAGPGTISWPGSTTDAASGIFTLSDVLYILPGLTPGSAQASPVPPVQSFYGSLYLKRASDSAQTVQVQSLRRAYAAGDEINITISSGASFSCTLSTENTYERTISIVAVSGTTTMSQVISALNALIPASPDNTQLVNATLVGGGSGTDLLLVPQTKQYISGNIDGVGYTLSPANLAGFFTSNPSQVLAEGDSLAVQFSQVSSTSSTGGRRQSIPENSNTLISASSLFNSRVHPELLVNALHICKVINGELVFDTGVAIAQGATNQPLGAYTAANISYSGGPNWADGTTNPATTVQAQLSKIVSDLAGSASGAAKIEGPTVGTYLTAGPLGTQIATMANFVHSDKAPAETNYTPLRTFNDYLGNPRSLIDHTGYRMGQVSEVDEDWTHGTGLQTIVHLDPVDGAASAGSPSVTGVDVELTTSSDVWVLPLSESVPSNAIINGIVVYYLSNNASNVLDVALKSTNLSPSGLSTVVANGVTTATTGTTEALVVGASPTSGHLPHQSLLTEKLSLSFSCTISGSNILLLDVQILYTVLPDCWTYTQGLMNLSASSDAISYNLPASGLSQRTVTLQTLGNGTGTGTSALTGPEEAWADSNLEYTLEFLVKTGTVDDSSHEFSTDLGVKIGSDAITAHWDFSYGSWQLNFNADSQTFTSTGVPVVANTLYLMKLEICGPNMNSAGGTNYRARLFINGALVANVAQAGTSITGNPVSVWFNTQTNAGSGGPYTLSIGRVRRRWNHFQTGYAI